MAADPMMSRLGSCVVVMTFCASLPAPASAQSDEVVALFEAGLEAYQLANYEEAERLFAQAHALEPLPDLSYNHARTLELLGRFGDAANVYARFLREAPDTDDREVIEARIQNLRQRHARATAQGQVDDMPPTDLNLGDTPPEAEPEANGPSLLGPLVVIGAGVALSIGGIAAGVAGSGAHDTALEPMTNQSDADAANRRASRLASVANTLFVLGGAAVAAGVTWLVVKLVKGGEGEGEVSLQIAPTGLALHGAF